MKKIILFSVLLVSILSASYGQYVTVGTANNVSVNEYQLTSKPSFFVAGAIWNQNQMNLNSNFKITLSLFFGDRDVAGGDGIAFVLQQSNTGLGSVGAGIGYAGISPSFDVEFDTWQDADLGDPVEDHLAINNNGKHTHFGPNVALAPVFLPNIEDGNWHPAIFDWNASTKVFTVTLDGIPHVLPYDITAQAFNGNSLVYWGVTAAVGGHFNDQRVRIGSVQVGNNVPPTYTVPGPVTIFKDASCNYNANPSITGSPTNIQDNCEPFPAVSYSDATAPGSCMGETIITRTWKVSDICNNTTFQTQVITVKDNTPPTFTRPADISILFTSPGVYDASPAQTGDVTNEADNCSTGLQATYTDVITPCGNNLIIQRTWHLVDNCNNAAADQVQTITVGDNLTNYVVYAFKEAKFGEDNVINGSVGVSDPRGTANFKKGCFLPSPFFAKAADVDVDHNANVPNRFEVPANDGPVLPFFDFSGNTAGLPDYTVNVSPGGPLGGNYKNLNIKKGVIVTLTGTLFGKINIEEGAQVTFNPSGGIVNIEDLSVKGKKDPPTTRIMFTSSTSVRMKNKVDIGDDVEMNVGGPNVTVYMGDDKKDEEKFNVKGGNTIINVNIYIKDGKIKVSGGDKDMTTMTGWFLAEKVESDGHNVVWNRNSCMAAPAPAPISAFATLSGTMDKPGMPPVTTEAFINVSKSGVQVAPNPSRGLFKVTLNNYKASKAEISILNDNGVVVAKQMVQLFGTQQSVSFDLGGKSSTIYYIRVISTDGVQNAKVLLQR